MSPNIRCTVWTGLATGPSPSARTRGFGVTSFSVVSVVFICRADGRLAVCVDPVKLADITSVVEMSINLLCPLIFLQISRARYPTQISISDMTFVPIKKGMAPRTTCTVITSGWANPNSPCSWTWLRAHATPPQSGKRAPHTEIVLKCGFGKNS